MGMFASYTISAKTMEQRKYEQFTFSFWQERSNSSWAIVGEIDITPAETTQAEMDRAVSKIVSFHTRLSTRHAISSFRQTRSPSWNPSGSRSPSFPATAARHCPPPLDCPPHLPLRKLVLYTRRSCPAARPGAGSVVD
jgi:hypothetical protein